MEFEINREVERAVNDAIALKKSIKAYLLSPSSYNPLQNQIDKFIGERIDRGLSFTHYEFFQAAHQDIKNRLSGFIGWHMNLGQQSGILEPNIFQFLAKLEGEINKLISTYFSSVGGIWAVPAPKKSRAEDSLNSKLDFDQLEKIFEFLIVEELISTESNLISFVQIFSGWPSQADDKSIIWIDEGSKHNGPNKFGIYYLIKLLCGDIFSTNGVYAAVCRIFCVKYKDELQVLEPNSLKTSFAAARRAFNNGNDTDRMKALKKEIQSIKGIKP